MVGGGGGHLYTPYEKKKKKNEIKSQIRNEENAHENGYIGEHQFYYNGEIKKRGVENKRRKKCE